MFESLEEVSIIGPESPFAASLSSSTYPQTKKRSDVPAINFITVGKRGLVRIWSADRALCLFEQKSSDIAVSSSDEDSKRGFISALIMPASQELLCVTADQQFFLHYPEESEGSLNLVLRKRFVGYNEEIVDMKFLGDEEQFLAVSTSVEQVRVYDLTSMSCSYVLAGHTDVILSLDTCVSNSGRTLIVTGSKDNTVRLWDCQSKACVGVGIGHMGAVGAVVFSKKQRNFFVSGSSDRTLKVWNLDSVSHNNEEVLTLKPNDSLVFSGSQDRTACIWRLPDLVSVVALKGHKMGIWSVEFSPVDQCVMTASGDKTIKIWAISDGSCLRTFEGHTSSVLRASFLTHGTQIVSCGADCLMKLWTVKTNECIATYDQNEAKIWALAVGKKTEMLATGGGDAVINLWHDSTALDKEETFRKEEEGVLRGQELENALIDGDYTKAIQIAFELRRPHKLLNLFGELCRKSDTEDQIGKALKAFGKKEFGLLLEYIREWNTKPKFCHIVQFVLLRVYSVLSATKIIEIPGLEELLEGLAPYSQRHFNRLDRLVRSLFMFQYTSAGMLVIEPEGNDGKLEDKDTKIPDVADIEQLSDITLAEEEQQHKELKEKSSSKKRKNKARHAASKKVRACVA